MNWTIPFFPRIDENTLRATHVHGAILSRVESGPIYWDRRPHTFVRGAVYDGLGRLVEGSQRRGGMNSDLVLSTNPPILKDSEVVLAHENRYAGRWLYIGHWMQGFGHFITETLPMLWTAIQGQSFDGLIAHNFTSRKGKYVWQEDLLRLALGTLPSVMVIDDFPMQVDHLEVPDRPYRYQQDISIVAAQVWEQVSGAVPRSESRPVYLSRTMLASNRARRFTNSVNVDQIFTDFGYDVIYPETMSVSAQIRAVSSAPIVAGQAGSALHLTAFAGSDAQVLELADVRSRTEMISTQRAIASIKGQRAALVPYIENTNGGLNTDHLVEHLERIRNE